MQVIVKGKNIQVTDALREYATAKASKIQKLGVEIRGIVVTLLVEKNPSIRQNQIADIDLYCNGVAFRAVGRDRDMYVAVDQAVSRAQRQIARRHGKKVNRAQVQPGAQDVQMNDREDMTPSIVKVKAISHKPMTSEEAVLQMETVGHDFFVFTDSESENTNVVYRRFDGNYGVIDYGVTDQGR